MSPRRKLLLGVLGVAAVIFLWSQLRPQDEVPTAAVSPLDKRTGSTTASRTGSRSRGRSGGRRDAPAVTTVSELRLADLEPATGGFHAGRNPFAFVAAPLPPPPPPPPPPTKEQIAARLAAEEAAQRAAAVAAVEAAKPKPPRITFSYLGSFGPPARRIAVLSQGETTYNAMVGDVIEGKFRLVAIGFESVEIGFVDFPNQPPAQLPVGEKGS